MNIEVIVWPPWVTNSCSIHKSQNLHRLNIFTHSSLSAQLRVLNGFHVSSLIFYGMLYV